ncbi:MAG: hypothetical protein LBO00_09675 [Zoogloeaceae bacterium]|jgi:hypothetical protein|nr:hypothetical protein [Zoogloeaceae bacterium]
MIQDNADTALEDQVISVSYTAVGCAHKDLVLLKSVMSLYGTQGNVDWNFQRSLEVDLVVFGTEIHPTEVISLLRSQIETEQVVLWISTAPTLTNSSHQILRCKSPLHAFQLAGQLKQVEAFLREKRASQPESAHAQLPPQSSSTEESVPDNVRLELVRWPSPDLLAGNRSSWRMAAMLGARSMTLSELSERSEQPREICLQFLRDLKHAGYIQFLASEAEENASKHAARPPHPSSPETREPSTGQASAVGGLRGLLRRIRVGLGLSSA